MKIYYNETTGEPFFAVYDSQLFSFNFDVSSFSEIEIDEIVDNKELCKDLQRYFNKGAKDINGLTKYYISGGELYERENWEEFVNEVEYKWPI